MIPVVVLVLLAMVAILAPVIETQPPLKNNIRERLVPPFWASEGNFNHILGTDNIGRDMWSRLVHGARISLIVAGVALVTGTIVGTALGLIAGYFGGLIDEVIMRFVDIWFGLPFILVAMIIAVMLTPSVNTMMGVLALLVWSSYVRYIRAGGTLHKGTRLRVAGASGWRLHISGPDQAHPSGCHQHDSSNRHASNRPAHLGGGNAELPWGRHPTANSHVGKHGRRRERISSRRLVGLRLARDRNLPDSHVAQFSGRLDARQVRPQIASALSRVGTVGRRQLLWPLLLPHWRMMLLRCQAALMSTWAGFWIIE